MVQGGRWFGQGLAVVLIAWSGASQAAAGPGVVLETHTAERSAQASAALRGVLRELAAVGFSSGQELSSAIESKLSRSGQSLNSAELARATQTIEAGYEKFLHGDFPAARTMLEEALASLRARPATVAREQALRDLLIKAYVGLALSSQRLGDIERAEATMAEFLRSLPDREISRSKFGPEPIELMKHVKAKLEAAPRAKLHIKSDDPASVIFMNERFVGVGEAEISGAYPGAYRIYSQRAKAAGRVHHEVLAGGVDGALEVSSRLDTVLKTDDGLAALVFEDNRARGAGELESTRALAVALGASQAMTVGVLAVQGQQSIMGTAIDVARGRLLRRAAIPLNASAALTHDLVLYLTEGRRAKGVIVLAGDAEKAAPVAAGPLAPTRARKGRGLRVAGWVTVGVGVLAIAGGTYFGLRANTLEDEVNSAKTWSGALAGKVGDGEAAARNANILIGAGAALVVGGGVLWYLGRRAGNEGESKRRTSLRPQLAPTALGLVVDGAF